MTRASSMSNHVALQRDYARSLDQRPTPTRKFGPAVTNPRISDLTRVDIDTLDTNREPIRPEAAVDDDGPGRRFTLPT